MKYYYLNIAMILAVALILYTLITRTKNMAKEALKSAQNKVADLVFPLFNDSDEIPEGCTKVYLKDGTTSYLPNEVVDDFERGHKVPPMIVGWDND